MNGNTKWKDIITALYPSMHNAWKYGNSFVIKMSREVENLFWENILKYFYEFHNKIKIKCLEDVYQTSFMYNESIKIGTKAISNQQLLKNGIFLIKQLMEEDEF